MYIGYSGAQSTRKTTSVYKLASDMKELNHDKSVGIITEVARDCPFQLMKQLQEEAQLWIFANQISRELDAISKYDIVISDRTLIDGIAYTMYAGFSDLANAMKVLAKVHSGIYDHVIFKTIKNNPDIRDDGFRSTNAKFRQDIEDIMLDVYNELGIDIMYDHYCIKG